MREVKLWQESALSAVGTPYVFTGNQQWGTYAFDVDKLWQLGSYCENEDPYGLGYWDSLWVDNGSATTPGAAVYLDKGARAKRAMYWTEPDATHNYYRISLYIGRVDDATRWDHYEPYTGVESGEPHFIEVNVWYDMQSMAVWRASGSYEAIILSRAVLIGEWCEELEGESDFAFYSDWWYSTWTV